MTHRPGAISALIAAAAFTLVGAAFLTDREPPPVYQTITPSQSSGFSFSWGSGRINDLVGTPVLVHEEAVPAEFAGRDCTLTGTVNASPSVHPGNVLQITFNGTPVDVLGVEDVANQEQSFSGTGTLNSVVRFVVVLGDGDTSPRFQTTSITGTASVTCLPPPTTSTSTPPTSEPPSTTPSTTSPTSTSVPPTSTTAPGTTTSEPPSSTPTTTVVTVPSVTSVPVTPTTQPTGQGTPTTSPPSSSSTSSHRCPPGTYSIGNGACAAVEESG